jgi:two-component system response regulator AgrA
MIPIYICEDNPEQTEDYAAIIRNTILIEEYDMQLIGTYQNPYQLLAELQTKIAENNSYGIYLELAAKIRELDSRAFIIFITTHAEAAPLTFQYQVEALDYIVKDQPELIADRLQLCLNKAHARTDLNHIDPIISFSHNRKTMRIRESAILYIATTPEPHQLRVVTVSDEFCIRGNLHKLSLSLSPATFKKSHRTTIVNCNHIQSIDYNRMLLWMSNGHTCPLSRQGIHNINGCLSQ